MKVALIHPRMYVRAYHFFPLGIGFLASALEKISVDYVIYDMHKDWMSVSQLIKRIEKDSPPDLFAISSFLTSFPTTEDLCTNLKQNFEKTKIVLGGRISVLPPEEILQAIPADFVIKGEGEKALIDLVEMLEGTRSPSSIKGLAYRDESGTVRANGETELLRDVSEFWIPFRNLDISKYISKKTVQSPNLPSLNMISGRGCPFACTFCNFSKEKNHRMRYYDLDILSDSWDYLMAHHGLKHVTFNDDIFTVDKQRIHAVGARLKERKLSFSCSTRLDCLDEEMIDILEDSGCRFLCLGIESPSPTVAAVIDKKLNLDKYQRNIQLLKSTSMTVNFGFMFGHLGETENTIQETRKFVLENNIVYSAFFATAFPGTKLYDLVEERIPDQREYLRQLAGVDLSVDYLVNMTDIPKKRLLGLRDRLVADSVMNILTINIPGLRQAIRFSFILYLSFMRRIGKKTAVFKRLFEYLNIQVIKPLMTSKKPRI
jgi:anaerobic magnesium-protoporphyrin IX monomethyl ester cyclase